MPEILSALAPAAIEGGAELATAGAPAAFDAAGGLAGAAAPFGFDALSSAGLPFAAGAGDLAGAGGGLAGTFGGAASGAAGAIGDVASTLGNFGFSAGDAAGGLAAVPGGDFAAAASAFPGAGAGVDLSGASASAFPGATPFNSFGATGAPVATVGDVASAGTGVSGAASADLGAAPGAAGATGAAAPAGAAPLDLSSAVNKAIGNVNPLSAALGAAGLGYTILQGNKQSAATGAIQNQASNVAGQAADVTAQGKSLVSHLESGTLPPNIQAQVDTNTKAAKTKIISNYAAQGMNTDPNHNSSLRQELASVDQQAKVLSGQLAQQLAASGTNLISAGTQLTGLDNNLLTTLSNIDQTQTQRMGSAIANFAAALNGNKGGINLKIA